MVSVPTVLISLSRDLDDEVGAVRVGLEHAVRDRGFASRFTTDAHETVAWVRRERFEVAFLDAEMEMPPGDRIWRIVRPLMNRRMVLMTRGRRPDVWFEALGCGVAAVLPLPAQIQAVRAALDAAVGPVPPI